MHRRALALPTLLTAAVLALAACGPSAPEIEDPIEILSTASENLTTARSVHLEASVEGNVNLDLMGAGAGAALTLEGTRLVGDIDIEAGDLQLHVEVPAMLGFTADVIVVGEEAFIRSTLTGPTYQRGTTGNAGLPLDPADPAASLADLLELLQRPEVAPEKLDDVDCHGERCYQVGIELTPEELLSLGGDLGGMPLGDAALQLQILVEKDSVRLAAFVIRAVAGEMGDLTVNVEMSKWDEGLAIAPPPANQVQP